MARARPAPPGSGAVRWTASEARPNPVMIEPEARAPVLASASTAAPSPSAIPSRSTRKGRGGGDAVTARSASNPAATKTVTSSNPPASTTSHDPRSSQRDPRPIAIDADAHAPRTSTVGSKGRPSRRTTRAIGPKYVAASTSITRSPRASEANARSAARMPPLDVPRIRPTRSSRQAGRARSRSSRQPPRALSRSDAARSSP